jgi:hypothetical protein
MRSFRVNVILLTTMCASTLAGAMPAVGATDVGLADVRFGGDSVATRVVLDLDAAVTGKLVPAESTGGRLVIALPTLLSTGPLQGPGKGLVTAWTLREDASGARLVLDATPGATIVKRFLIPPSDDNSHWRYVIDLASGAPASTLADRSAPRRQGR